VSEYTSLSSSNHIDVSTVPSISHDWPPKTDLAELFSKLGLGKYTDLFTQQEVGSHKLQTTVNIIVKWHK